MIPGDQFLKSFLAFVLAVNGGHDLDGSRRIGNQKKIDVLDFLAHNITFAGICHHCLPSFLILQLTKNCPPSIKA